MYLLHVEQSVTACRSDRSTSTHTDIHCNGSKQGSVKAVDGMFVFLPVLMFVCRPPPVKNGVGQDNGKQCPRLDQRRLTRAETQLTTDDLLVSPPAQSQWLEGLRAGEYYALVHFGHPSTVLVYQAVLINAADSGTVLPRHEGIDGRRALLTTTCYFPTTTITAAATSKTNRRGRRGAARYR